jgi:hypothetical protein
MVTSKGAYGSDRLSFKEVESRLRYYGRTIVSERYKNYMSCIKWIEKRNKIRYFRVETKAKCITFGGRTHKVFSHWVIEICK